jgi:hypothetical protein
LQAALPDYEVTNFGIGGYGTYQSLLQLREALSERRHPEVIVLGYAFFHDRRNTFTRSQRRTMVPHGLLKGMQYPFVRLEDDDRLSRHVGSVEFRPWTLSSRSHLVSRLEHLYDRWDERALRSREATQLLILEVAELARQNDIQLVLALIATDEGSRQTEEWARREGIAAADISVDLSRPEYRNLPHDPHPSPAANREYARRLLDSLRPGLQEQRTVARPESGS